jgi:hypothetical protein
MLQAPSLVNLRGEGNEDEDASRDGAIFLPILLQV